MKLKTIIILGFICLSGILHAQSNFKQGYVIREVGDTLRGEIDSRGDISMSEICRFREINSKEITKFKPNSIIAYRLTDNKYFVSKKINGKYKFLELLVEGQTSLYYNRENQLYGNYYVGNNELGIKRLPYSEEIIERDGATYLIKSNKHNGILLIYLKDAPTLRKRIESLVKPGHNPLTELIETYNDIVCNEIKCITYQKEKFPITIYIEPTVGFIKYKNLSILSKNYFQAGIIANIWLPRVNEKLYLRTGIIRTPYEMNVGKIYNYESNKIEDVIKEDVDYIIPIQLEYISPERTFIPKFAYGINYHRPFEITVGLMAGLLIRAHEKANISISYDFDFIRHKKIPIVPKQLGSQRLSFGLQFKL